MTRTGRGRGNRNGKRVRIDPQPREGNTANQTNSSRVSPTQKAEEQLERGIASRPTELQQLMSYHGKRILKLQRDIFNKKNTYKKMEDNQDYIPRSAKINFQLTFSKETEERDEERTSTLRERAEEAKNLFQTTVKTLIIQAAKEDRATLKYRLWEETAIAMHSITKSHIISGNITGEPCPHTMVHNVLRNCSGDTLIEYYGGMTINDFLTAYIKTHGLATMPAAVEINAVPDDLEAPDRDELLAAAHAATNHVTNRGITRLYKFFMECIHDPWEAFLKQTDLNEKALALKQINAEVIEGQATEDTAMQVDQEVPADRQQLNDLISNKVRAETQKLQKQIKEQSNMLQQLLQANKDASNNDNGNFNRRGQSQPGASNNKKKSGQQSNRKQNNGSRNNNNNRNRNNNRGRSRSRSQSRTNRGRRSSRNSSAGSRADDSDNGSRGGNSSRRPRSSSSNRRSNRRSRNSNNRSNRS